MKTDDSKITWTGVLEKGIATLLTIIMGFIAWQSTKWTEQIEFLTTSVSQLNTKMEVVVTQMTYSNAEFQEIKGQNREQGKTINEHETRIRILERR